MAEKTPGATLLIPFGKYKGQPIEAIRADKGYIDWLLSQDWFRTRYVNLHQTIVNNFGEPTETPEHNRLQARFLDRQFALAMLWLTGPRSVENPRAFLTAEIKSSQERLTSPYLESWKRQAEEEALADALRRLADFDADPPQKPYEIAIRSSFEVSGWDVVLRADLALPRWKIWDSVSVYIEIKPALGDEFPAVLRQMKANRPEYGEGGRRYALLIDQFSAGGATLDEVRTIFWTEGFRMVMLSEVGETIRAT
jgi:hypothetical protein